MFLKFGACMINTDNINQIYSKRVSIFESKLFEIVIEYQNPHKHRVVSRKLTWKQAMKAMKEIHQVLSNAKQEEDDFRWFETKTDENGNQIYE